MKWAILRIAKGKEEIIEVGDRSKLSNRLKQLRSSTRNGVSGRGRKKIPNHLQTSTIFRRNRIRMKERKTKFVVLFPKNDIFNFHICSGVFHNTDDIIQAFRVFPVVETKITESAIEVRQANGEIVTGSIHKVLSFL